MEYIECFWGWDLECGHKTKIVKLPADCFAANGLPGELRNYAGNALKSLNVFHRMEKLKHKYK